MSTLHASDLFVFLLYFIAIIAIGVKAARTVVATKRDYFLAGDRLPWWMIGGSIVASNISSHHLVGVMGVAYSRGFIAMTIEWGAVLVGFNALLWIFLPFYLRNGFYTMPEYLERRFGGAARGVYGALIMLTYVFVEISAVLYMGAIALHALLGWNIVASIVGLAAFTAVYTIVGGLRAVVWTEMLQLCVLLCGGLALAALTISKAGGVAGVMARSHEWDLILPATDPDFPWTQYLGGLLCISVFYCATNQFIVQRALAARNEWHARMGIVFNDYIKFLMPLVIIVPGLVAPALIPGLEKTPDDIFPTLVREVLPHGLVGLVMAGLIAAIMGHISGTINSCTTIATMDFYLPYLNKGAGERQAVRFGRLFGIAVVIVSVLVAFVLIRHRDKPIFLFLLNAYGYFTPGIATMFLMGVFWRRTTHAGALAAGLATVPLTLLFQFATAPEQAWFGATATRYLAPFMNRTGVVFWLCIVLCAAVSLVTRPKSDAELRGLIWNRASLSLPPEERAQQRGLRNPALWWALVTAAILAFYVRYH